MSIRVPGKNEVPRKPRAETLDLLRSKIKNPRALKTLSDDALGLMEAALPARELGCTGEEAAVVVALDRFSWGEEDLEEALETGNFSKNLQPLWLLKHLPNTPAAQIAIELSAHGPCQTVLDPENAPLQARDLAEDWLRRGEAKTVLLLSCQTVDGKRTYTAELLSSTH